MARTEAVNFILLRAVVLEMCGVVMCAVVGGTSVDVPNDCGNILLIVHPAWPMVCV